MSPLISRVGSSFGFNRRAGGAIYTPVIPPVIPTDSLYSHWDFSLLSDTIGTTYTTDNTLITGASGTSIGAVSGTPQLYHRRSGTGTFTTTISTQNGNKCLSVAQNTATTGTGAFLQSDGNAYPDISSSSVSYTWIAVWKHTTTLGGYTRVYRWYLNTSAYDFNHGVWWLNSSGSSGELNTFTYAGAQRFTATPSADTNRPSTSIVHYEIVSITANSYEASYNTTVGGTSTVTGTFGGNETYGTTANANRYFQIRPVNYSQNNYPAMLACEFAFYNRSMGATERGTTLTALKNKWG
jgi:hypothetical protein